MVDGKIPVEETLIFNPPNALRLSWLSAFGGDWEMAVHVSKWRNRDIIFKGDTLSFWCYSPEEIPPAELPLIFLKDVQGIWTPSVPLGEFVRGLPAKKWVQIKIAMRHLLNPEAAVWNTAEEKLSKIKSVCFTQAEHDGKKHTLYFDEIKFYDGNRNDSMPPVKPVGLTAKAYDSHIDLQWQANEEDDLQHYQIYRSFDGKNYQPVGIQKADFCRYADFLAAQDKKAFYKISAVDIHYHESKL
ncbi:hypothetical protein L0152_32465, partial [bacterium]|nr:hypothetical protein [bacterium]